MVCTIKPLWDNVVLRRDRLKATGVIIPHTVQKRNAPTRGVVVSVGPGVQKIEVGKTYLHGRHGGDWINADGMAVAEDDSAEFYIVKDVDLIAEVENV